MGTPATLTGLLCSTALFVLSSPGYLSPYLACIFLVPALYIARRIPVKRMFLLGILQGTVAYGTADFWVINSLLDIFKLNVISSVFLSIFVFVICFGILYSLFFVLSGITLGYFFDEGKKFSGKFFLRLLIPVVPIITWGILEYIRGNVFPGINYTTLTSFFYEKPFLLQLLPFTGEYVFSGFIIMINIFFYILLEFFLKKNEDNYSVITEKLKLSTGILTSAVVICLVAIIISGINNSDKADSLPCARSSLVMVQANIPSYMKWKRKYQGEILDRYLSLTTEALTENTSCVIWPETALNFYPQLQTPHIMKLKKFSRENGVDIFSGAPEFEDFGNVKKYYNSIFRISGNSVIPVYRKEKLIAFAEYCPVSCLYPFFKKMIGENQFSSGLYNEPVKYDKMNLSFSVCFETTFPSSVYRRATGTDIHLVLSDTIWLGNITGQHQQLAAEVLRAIENNIWILSCSNGGITAVITPSGKIIKSLDMTHPGTLSFP